MKDCFLSHAFKAQSQAKECGTDDPGQVEKLKSTEERLTGIARKLQDSCFKSKIVSEMIEYMYDNKFCDNLDSKPHLLAFTNGVWDLSTSCFRQAKSEDLLSLSVGYDFVDGRDEERRQCVIDYWKSLHPDQEQREYVIKTFSRQLFGDNGLDLFHIHSGSQGTASNGKTNFFEVLEM